MTNLIKKTKLIPGAGLLALLCCMLLTGCSTTKVKYLNLEVAKHRYKEPMMLIPPLSQDASMAKSCKQLGNYFLIAMSARVDGQITYAGNIESLNKAVTWQNLVTNGMVNVKEVSTISRTIGCNSAVTVRVLQYKRYPPFRMVLEVLWIDCLSNNVIAKLYDDVDLTNTDTSYRFENYVGDGPARTVYETFTYAPYKGLSKTAALQPTVFLNFVADYSAEAMFGKASMGMDTWWFWRIF